MKKKLLLILLLPLIVIPATCLVIILFSDRKTSDSETIETTINYFYEKIPGSKNHSPDATWWGYNQSKIARHNDTVFMYVIHNDDNPATESDFTIYKKEGDNSWVKGAKFPSSRPGNILVDSQGVLHAFVFEPIDILENDSLGILKHYWFPNASTGDITNYKEETVIHDKGQTEMVNIRTGAAIGKDDTMAIGFGLTEGNTYNGHSEHLYYKRPNESKWKHLIAGEELGHDFYYPFVLVSDIGFHLLAVQDDYVPSGDNVYQIIEYFEYNENAWTHESLADLRNHPLSSERLALLEQSELFEDAGGTFHVIYKERLNPKKEWEVSELKHLTKSTDEWETKSLKFDIGGGNETIDWVRLVEIDNQLYYIATSNIDLYLGKVGNDNLTRMNMPNALAGPYLYVADTQGQTNANEKYVDILLLSGDMKAYPDATNYYVRIPKEEFSKIK